jgi:hypothetical protein
MWDIAHDVETFQDPRREKRAAFVDGSSEDARLALSRIVLDE